MNEDGVLSHLLHAELDLWARDGVTANFWWRDDDAIDASAQLETLANLSESNNLTVGLAVIPARIQSGLSGALAVHKHLIPLCHGYRHENHARFGPMAEFGPDRPIESLIEDARNALDIFHSKLGDRGFPVFVVPFNRIERQFEAILPQLGFAGVSAGPSRWERWLSLILARTPRLPAVINGRKQHRDRFRVDAHLSPIEWTSPRAPADPHSLAHRAVGLLRARRLAMIDRDLPVGIVTHHLDHSPEIWQLTGNLIHVLRQHPATCFLSPYEIFSTCED